MQLCWLTSSVWFMCPDCGVGGAEWEDAAVWEEVTVDKVLIPTFGTEVSSMAVGTKESSLAALEGV